MKVRRCVAAQREDTVLMREERGTLEEWNRAGEMLCCVVLIFLQPIADALKLFIKEPLCPPTSSPSSADE